MHGTWLRERDEKTYHTLVFLMGEHISVRTKKTNCTDQNCVGSFITKF